MKTDEEPMPHDLPPDEESDKTFVRQPLPGESGERTALLASLLQDARYTRRAIDNISAAIGELKTAVAGVQHINTQVEEVPTKVALLQSDVNMLKTIVFGGIGVVLVTVLCGVLYLVVRNPQAVDHAQQYNPQGNHG
jgi:hypothetical protein